MPRVQKRNKGEGGAPPRRRKVAPRELDVKARNDLEIMRQKALSGLSDLVELAVGTLADCLRHGPERAQGSRSSDARYVLDVVLERIAAPVERDEAEGEPGEVLTTPVDELAQKRLELQEYLRGQRRASQNTATQLRGLIRSQKKDAEQTARRLK